MPELKNLFIKGKMNKDLDERLVPQGEYRDALNISVSYSEGSDVGALQNILGNTERNGGLSFPAGATCIGTVRDTENDKIYWFGTSAAADYIAELDPSDNSVDIILCDAGIAGGKQYAFNSDTSLLSIADGEIKANNSDLSLATQLGVSLTTYNNEYLNTYYDGATSIVTSFGTFNGSINTINGSRIIFNITSFSAGGDAPENNDIIYVDPITINTLNFSASNLITGVAVLDGVLYFTDDLNEPRQVDIEYWRGVTATDFTTSTNLSDDRISLYKKGPLNAPTFHTFSSSARNGVGTEADETRVVTNTIPNLSTLDINSTDNNVVFSENTAYEINDVISLNKNTTITNSEKSTSARILLTSKTSASQFSFTLLSKSENIENATNLNYEAVLEEDEPLFKLKFPRFAYRYKYTNGQYSAFSPFSLPAFIPGDFEYDAKRAYNLGMENTIRSLKLEGWITSPSLSNYQADIEEIDILYKDSVSSNVYIVDSIKKTENNNTEFPATFEIKDEQIFKAAQSNQLLRPFDSIPKKAKALEITGNRLIFGNYLQNFNYTDKPLFNIKTVSRTNSNEILSKFSLKSLRTYQAGIAFLDAYGRQTPVFTDKSGIFKINKDSSDLNLQFEISTTTSAPSEITHYKYYIKETSNEYYNICVSNIYDDKEGFIYLSFPSAEINKVSAEDYIILKKQSGDVSYKETDNKFKVIDKLNNPPSFLTEKFNVTYISDRLLFGDDYGEDATLLYKSPGRTPVAGYNTIVLQDAGSSLPGEVGDETTEVTETFMTQMVPGTIIRFRKAGTDIVSNNYTIKLNTDQKGQFDGDDQRETEIVFEEQFGDDVEALYPTTAEFTTIARSSIVMEKLEKTNDEGNPEYQGKFFIKLNNNGKLKTALEESFDESTLNTLATHLLNRNQSSQDRREYFVSALAETGGSLSYGGFTTPNGFHIAITTAELYNDSGSFYFKDPFLRELQEVGNYVRFSDAQQTSMFKTTSTTFGAVTNNINVTLSSTNSNIQVGDTVEAAASTGFNSLKETFVVSVSGTSIILNTAQTIASGSTLTFRRATSKIPNYRIEEVKINPTPFTDGQVATVFLRFNKNIEVSLPGSGTTTKFAVDVRKFDINKAQAPTNPPIFEVEPKEGVLDIYYETEKTYEIADLASAKEIPWANCISFGNGVESDRIRDDYNTPTIGKGVRVSTVFEDNYKEERVKSGLIFSGLYNGKNGINRLNQFIVAENITEEANPIYGSIQKLNTRDTDLTLLCDDAILKVPARKDLLFQADGNPQVTSTDRFLGTIIPYAGNYGCQHPESFADHIYRAYFVDKTRGKVLRLGGDGITEISNYGMKDYFKDKLRESYNKIVGSYDENKDQYNVSFVTDFIVTSDTVSFSESVNGWPSRKSFIPEAGISLNSMYYTFKDGKIYSHDNPTRNTFYSGQTASTVTALLNGNPGSIKNFRTLNYQGDSGWIAAATSSISTNSESGAVISFVEKEGIYYNYIQGVANNSKSTLDLKSLNVQGLGTPTNITGNNITFSELNNALQVGDVIYNNLNDTSRVVTNIVGNVVTLDGTPTNAFNFFAKDNRFNTSGILGYYMQVTLSNFSSDKKELYSIGSEVSLSS